MHLLVTQVGKNRPYVSRDIRRICKILKFKMKTELLGFGYLIIVLQMPLRMVFSDQQSIISSRIFLPWLHLASGISLVIYTFLCIWLPAMKKCLLSVRHREQWWESWPRHGESAAGSQLFHKKLPSRSLPRWLCGDWLRWTSSEAIRHYSKVRSLSLAWREFFRCLLPPHCNCFSRDEQWMGP